MLFLRVLTEDMTPEEARQELIKIRPGGERFRGYTFLTGVGWGAGAVVAGFLDYLAFTDGGGPIGVIFEKLSAGPEIAFTLATLLTGGRGIYQGIKGINIGINPEVTNDLSRPIFVGNVRDYVHRPWSIDDRKEVHAINEAADLDARLENKQTVLIHGAEFEELSPSIRLRYGNATTARPSSQVIATFGSATISARTSRQVLRDGLNAEFGDIAPGTKIDLVGVLNRIDDKKRYELNLRDFIVLG